TPPTSLLSSHASHRDLHSFPTRRSSDLSHAVQAMELGYDGVLLNTAVAQATEPVLMAQAFGEAIEAGRKSYIAGAMPERQTAQPSTPTLGTPFWHQP